MQITCYRPQRSCGQGNVFTGVCLSTGGGGCLPQCMLGCQIPLDQAHPTPPYQALPRTGQIPPDQADPPQEQADTPPGTGRHPPRNRQTPPWNRQTPPPQADHPPPRPGRPPHQEADSSIRSTSGRYASYWNAFLFYNLYNYPRVLSFLLPRHYKWFHKTITHISTIFF